MRPSRRRSKGEVCPENRAGQKFERLKGQDDENSKLGLFGRVDFQRVPSTIPESASRECQEPIPGSLKRFS